MDVPNPWPKPIERTRKNQFKTRFIKSQATYDDIWATANVISAPIQQQST
jgi:hypothetical protein